jgi:ribonucleoside-diphosphate reductase alpha chain
MIAPTGTISILADTSSGIEPVFSLVTKRRTFYEDDKSNHSTRELVMVDPVLKEYLKSKYKKKEIEDILTKLANNEKETLSKEERKLFVTTHEVEPEWHVKIQAAWQESFDNSISKTINFPSSATVEEVEEAYMQAWRAGCKGITIYRDGSKQDQVLVSSGSVDSVNPVCPECGGTLRKEEGCSKCYDCGFSVCG